MISVSAFAQKEVRLGAFLGYGSEVDRGALGMLGEFMLNEKMSITPSLAFYFPQNDNDVRYTAWEVNGNFNYYFYDEPSLNIYGLGGFNIISEKVKWDDHPVFGNTETSDSGVGLNLGIGCNIKVNEQVLPFGELKFTVGEVNQVFLSFGAKFRLN
jgi:outer membrane protein X